jgi:hypothetical protein
MDIVPMIVRFIGRRIDETPDGRAVLSGDTIEYFPQVVMPNGSLWRGPSVGKNLTQNQIDYQYGLLETAVRDHGLNPEEMGWTELTF